jgi:hypothetical protein
LGKSKVIRILNVSDDLLLQKHYFADAQLVAWKRSLHFLVNGVSGVGESVVPSGRSFSD